MPDGPAETGQTPPAPTPSPIGSPGPSDPSPGAPERARGRIAPGGGMRDPNWPAVTVGGGEGRAQIDPHLYLHPRTLARLDTFELRAKMIVEGVMSGQHRSPYAGVSVEFAQHRPYAPGDDIRHLDWKVYARTDKLQIKQFQQETNLDLVVLCDSSGSMDYGTRPFADASGKGETRSLRGNPSWTKYDHATALSAALAYITLSQGDRCGMVVFADEIRSIVNRTSGRNAWRRIVDVLAMHPVDRQTSISRLMDQTLGKVTNRCLFALVTDFFDDLESMRSSFARLKHLGHDLICFQVLDEAEETFNFQDVAPFVGLEGEPTLRVDPRAIRRDYLEAINRHNNELEKMILSFGFDYQKVRTSDWLGPPLASFVAHRNAIIKRSKFG
ncbi:MAG: DUF58 domain-containing protein [Phycisphaerales bacterium JB040]